MVSEKLSGPFEVSRSSDGTSEWFSARDPAAGVSIRAKDRADALSMVAALNACVAHHATTRAPADLRSALEAGRFLLDRLVDHEIRMTSDEDAREWFGHVTPAMARFRAALAPTKGDAS